MIRGIGFNADLDPGPQGTRVLLAENRGGGAGHEWLWGGIHRHQWADRDGYVGSCGGANQSGGGAVIPNCDRTLLIDYNFFTVPDTMHVYYDGE